MRSVTWKACKDKDKDKDKDRHRHKGKTGAKAMKQKPAAAPASTSTSVFAELGQLRDALKADATQRKREQQQAQATASEAAVDATLFRHAIGNVTPLRTPSRATAPRVAPSPSPLQTQRDEQAVLREAISDDFDPEALLDADDALSYLRAGVNSEVARKLRRGAWTVQAQLDLHGLRRDEARMALQDFLRDADKRGLRCVRIIHGKGLGSVGREPVLKGFVRTWLVQKENVLAFCQARPHDGGDGAMLVLLQQKHP
jgi:DNA-nicking Smr family endonuclease